MGKNERAEVGGESWDNFWAVWGEKKNSDEVVGGKIEDRLKVEAVF